MTVIPIVIFLTLMFTTFLSSFAHRSSYGSQVVVLFSYIFCIGVIIHEAAHRLMCFLFRVEVDETRYFRVERKKIGAKEYTNIGGYVRCKDVPSVIAGLSMGVAPLFVNGLLVTLLYYYYPSWTATAYEGLLIYLGIALAIGARPSGADLVLWFKILRKYPRRGFFELGILCIFGGVLLSLLIQQINPWIILAISLVFLFSCIMLGRRRPSSSDTSCGGFV